jgi:nucleotide-binding universal stress UspA family protein
MILIAYDSSDDAKAAIQHAGRLMRGQTAIVVSVWEPFMTMIARTPAGLGPISGMSDIERIDETLRQTVERHAQEGAQLARAAGLDASARIASRSGSIAEAILAAAEETGAAAIVLGSRGLTGLKSMMLGSVSHAIVQHADRPVLVVPSPAVAERRQQHTRSSDEQRA